MESFFAGMFSPEWFAAFTSIVLLDLILSGDNAILIALACKNLPPHHRGRAIIVGGMGAVLIRICCTLFATGLLAAPYLEFIGGALLLYIAVKPSSSAACSSPSPSSSAARSSSSCS